MDSESSVDHRRLYDDERQSGRRWFYPHTQKPEWISYGLLALLYALILTLFITVYSGAKAPSKHLITLKEMSDFRGKVHNLSAYMDDIHTSVKPKTCEAGWRKFDDSCYSLTVFKADWPKIRSSCLKKGSDLAVVNSAREQIFLASFSDASTSKRYWIGLHDMDEEGTWIWVDGTDYKTSHQYWKKGEPNDNDGNEDCAHLWSFGEWNDVHCDYDNAYGICEKKL